MAYSCGMSPPTPTPFRIQTSTTELEDLQRRLRSTRWPEKELVSDWSQGIPLAYVQELCEYWADKYDWNARLEEINALPQFTLPVNGCEIHFLHQGSPEPDATPLILSHGWPCSFLNFRKVVGPLTDPRSHGGDPADAFHVVCPTLPGFGLSGKPTETGFGVAKIAETWSLLMAALGYDSYYAQGGDWGAAVTASIGAQDPAHCKGIHLNMPMAPPDKETMGDLSEGEKSALAGLEHYQRWDSGYSKQQSTRPQTLGYALADSPTGQAAWIIEKFWSWMDCKGHPENVLTRDELLDNVMLYWLGNASASSGRLYWESFNSMQADPISIPVGCSNFPHEIFRTSERWARKHYPTLVYYHDLDRGGHFPALEVPDLFLNEVRSCFRAVRSEAK